MTNYLIDPTLMLRQYSDNYYVATLMESLCHAMLGKPERPSEVDDFDMERVLEAQAEEQLEKDAIAEIDRYRRMDEWSSSFQNIYSRAALRCQVRLMEAKILSLDIMQFLPYTRAGTYDLLRLDAFECLIELDIFQYPELLRWFIFTMSNDSSALIRCRLHNLFGKALAPVAFGRETKEEAPASNTDNLIIEQESSTEVRQADLARRQTVTGALNALKKEISGDQLLKESLWAACNSPCIGILELSEFTDLCRVLYDAITTRMVSLKYPRYWTVKHLGKVRIMENSISTEFLLTQPRDACTSSEQTKSARHSRPQKIQQPPRNASAKSKAWDHRALVSHSSSPRWHPVLHHSVQSHHRSIFQPSCTYQTFPPQLRQHSLSQRLHHLPHPRPVAVGSS